MNKSQRTYPLLAIFLFLAVHAQAQMPFEEWVNLARTNLATASVSSVNGNRSTLNRYYGAANLFDGGNNPINHINYDYWLSDAEPKPHWVEVVFSKAVDIHALKIEVGETQKPTSFQMVVVIEGLAQDNEEPLGPFNLSENSAYYALPKPLEQVTKIRLLFDAPQGISIAEIEILGKTKASYQKVDRPHVEDDGKLRPEAGPPPAEIDTLINHYFRAISGNGSHNWQELNSLCEADVQFLVIGINEKGKHTQQPMSLKQFKKYMSPYIDKDGFFQIDFNRQIRFYYGIAQVWSEFESRHEPNGPPIDRGMISFQLAEVKGKWKIGRVMWNSKPRRAKAASE